MKIQPTASPDDSLELCSSRWCRGLGVSGCMLSTRPRHRDVIRLAVDIGAACRLACAAPQHCAHAQQGSIQAYSWQMRERGQLSAAGDIQRGHARGTPRVPCEPDSP